MHELGYGDNYTVRYRQFVVPDRAIITIKAYNQLYFLIDPHPSFTVKSKFGVFDLTIAGINELQHEHKGKIVIENTGVFTSTGGTGGSSPSPTGGTSSTLDPSSVTITFIQVIPKHKRK